MKITNNFRKMKAIEEFTWRYDLEGDQIPFTREIECEEVFDTDHIINIKVDDDIFQIDDMLEELDLDTRDMYSDDSILIYFINKETEHIKPSRFNWI